MPNQKQYTLHETAANTTNFKVNHKTLKSYNFQNPIVFNADGQLTLEAIQVCNYLCYKPQTLLAK
jgi:hypothetical protein